MSRHLLAPAAATILAPGTVIPSHVSSRFTLRNLCTSAEQSASLTQTYQALVQSDTLKPDVSQEFIIAKLQKQSLTIQRHQAKLRAYIAARQAWEASIADRIATGDVPCTPEDSQDEVQNPWPPAPKPPRVPRGTYLWGPVGSGKTLLMDLFYTALPLPEKRRVHFHDFMRDVHARIHAHQQEQLRTRGRAWSLAQTMEQTASTPAGYPEHAIELAARDMAQQANVLCLDEFQVTDIADAAILTRLFNALWQRGVVLLATSNRPPEELYIGGLNRDLFLPFLDALGAHCMVRPILSEVDYRRAHIVPHAADGTPAGAHVDQALVNTHQAWWNISAGPHAESGLASAVQQIAAARAVTAPEAAAAPAWPGTAKPVQLPSGATIPAHEPGPGILVSDFATLCEGARGAADYASLCAEHDVLVVRDIPALTPSKADAAKRFITLIDVAYDDRVKLLCTAADSVDQLFSSVAASVANLAQAPTPAQPAPAHDPAGQLLPDELDVSKPMHAAGSDPAAGGLASSVAQRAALDELAFACERATSRLIEMGSPLYGVGHVGTLGVGADDRGA